MRIFLKMSYNRQDALKFLCDNNFQRIEHLLLIYFYNTETTVDHWLSEVCKWSNISPRVKPKNRLLKYKTVYNAIWTTPKDNYSKQSIKVWLKNIVEEKPTLKLIQDFDYEKVQSYLNEFFKWLSNELSQKDRLDNVIIKQKIKELVTKYM